jgi:GT2 family glycosyltransferase
MITVSVVSHGHGAMVTRLTEQFLSLDGFDEGFFLYYEDVDICARLQAGGIIGCTDAQVVHKAQRASWHSWRYRRYHLTSIARYFSRDWRRCFPATLRHGAR